MPDKTITYAAKKSLRRRWMELNSVSNYKSIWGSVETLQMLGYVSADSEDAFLADYFQLSSEEFEKRVDVLLEAIKGVRS